MAGSTPFRDIAKDDFVNVLRGLQAFLYVASGLKPGGRALYQAAMIRTSLCALAVLLTTSAAAQQFAGSFRAWTAATHREARGAVCYAFTRPVGPGRPSGILTVMHRPYGRNQVAVEIGRGFRSDAEVTVTAGATDLRFYVADGIAFARDGSAAVAAFRKGQTAVVKGAGRSRRTAVQGSFSLAGFGSAYSAISRQCPAPTPRRIGNRSGQGARR